MNEFGEPNMGNPSVRFDEAGENWSLAVAPLNPFSSAYSTKQREKAPAQVQCVIP